MASKVFPSSSLTAASPRFQVSEKLARRNNAVLMKNKAAEKKASSPCRAAAQSEEVTQDKPSPEFSARTQLDLLEQLKSSTVNTTGYKSDDGDSTRPTVREQLYELTQGRGGDFSLGLGKRMKESMRSLNILTVSQRRNIKRKAYLHEVSQRNDATFFASIGAFVIVPPVLILAVAMLTGYVQLFP
ncbi:hypothetical protein AXF42_Ash011054 [Apostasia shenzhenica]|uniref:Uncharacterized protein n=1 Tax=Apostasia shenzhenica TaxID=1088818 RepID=A0A2H9ZQZ1_9ASPA|nr:hypothetical protein AXF42_Ash011054 [Apostasia shenzhenica]